MIIELLICSVHSDANSDGELKADEQAIARWAENALAQTFNSKTFWTLYVKQPNANVWKANVIQWNQRDRRLEDSLIISKIRVSTESLEQKTIC